MERVRLVFLLAVAVISTQDLFGNHRMVESVARSNNFTLFEENGKVGLKDEAGRVLIPASYDAIGWSNGKLSIIDKVVGYQSDGLWGLIHTSNKVITPAEFLDLQPGEGSFLIAQKKSPLSQRASFGIINTSGKAIIPFQYDGLQLSNMRAVVMSRSGTRFLFGLTDLSHKILIPLEYQRIYSLGSLRFAVENFEHKTAIFSEEGNAVTKFTIDSISAFKKDYAIVYQDQRQGLIDRNGQFVFQPSFGTVRLKDDGSIEARETDSWFFLDGQNNLLSQHQADAIKPLSPDHYAVINSGKLQLTDNNFHPLLGSFFSSVSDFRNGVALYRKSQKTGVVTAAGDILLPAEYQTLIPDQNVFLACLDVSFRNRWVMLDARGTQLTDKHYEHIAPFNGKYYAVRNRGFWGAVDKTGKEILTCVHDSLVQHNGNNLVVKFKGEYGIVNMDGNWIVTPTPNPLALLNEKMYFEYGGSTTFLKSIPGNLVYFSGNPLEYNAGTIRENLPSGAYWTIDPSGIIVDRSHQPDHTEQVFPESEGFRAIRKDGKFGFIDKAGRLRVANRYEAAGPFSGGLAAIRINNKWGFIDQQEKLIVQPVYDEVENFKAGYAIVKRDNLAGLMDKNGTIVLPLRYDEILVNDHNRFILRQGRSYGLVDASETVIIHPKYDSLLDTGNGYVIVQRDGKFGLLTLHGVSTIPMIYDGLTYDPYHEHFIAVKKSPWKTVVRPQSK